MRLPRLSLRLPCCGVLAALALCGPAKLLPAAETTGPFRALAPGVEITIPPDRQEQETVTTGDVVEILQGIPGLEWSPKYAPETETLRQMASGTEFRREIWCLELTFKPLRMIWVDVPQASGKAQRKLIWYLVYRVKNTGGNLKPAQKDDGTVVIEPVNREIRFFPTFVLEAQEYQKAYLDRIIPVAIQAIRQKEDPNRKLLDSVEVGSKLIPLSTDLLDKSVWGVATWEDVDPRVDYFSIYIEGLTNAYKWIDKPDEFKPGDPPTTGRQLMQKNLMLNFWRPGDRYREDERIIRYGIPDKVDYSWVYR
ncbi:MAG: hypothetical protein WD063_21000 [Pirellulales bacterium]